jgi:hypothetical protein
MQRLPLPVAPLEPSRALCLAIWTKAQKPYRLATALVTGYRDGFPLSHELSSSLCASLWYASTSNLCCGPNPRFPGGRNSRP